MEILQTFSGKFLEIVKMDMSKLCFPVPQLPRKFSFFKALARLLHDKVILGPYDLYFLMKSPCKSHTDSTFLERVLMYESSANPILEKSLY